MPVLQKKSNQKTAQLPLDPDAEDLTGVKWVQMRVVALNDNDEEITDDHKQVIEALSERIFLELGQELPEESVEKNPRLRTSPNLPFGYLEIAQTYKDKEWQISSPLWKEGDIDYFSLKIGDSQQCRIGVSAILHRLETKALNTPASFGRYAYTIIDFDTFEEGEVIVRNPPQITSQSKRVF